MSDRQLISSGTIWERQFGYSRAVRVGNLIAVAGTTAVDEYGVVVGAGEVTALVAPDLLVEIEVDAIK